MRTSPPAANDPGSFPGLREALAGVRALVLDVDGVLLMRGAALPGGVEALTALDARGIPFRVATNFTAAHRGTLAARFQAAGLPVPEERIATACTSPQRGTRPPRFQAAGLPLPEERIVTAANVSAARTAAT